MGHLVYYKQILEQKGVEAFNLIRTRSPGRLVNLRNTNLSDMDLQNVNFGRMYDENRDSFGIVLLSGANLSHCRLQHANLRGAILDNAVLHHAKLQFADMRESRLCETDMRGANLHNADMSRAYISRTVVRAAYLQKAKTDDLVLDLGPCPSRFWTNSVRIVR